MKHILFIILATLALQSSAQQPSDLDAYLRRAAENGYHGSVLVADKGKILLENGYGLADRESGRRESAETVFCTGSVTKQFTAAAVMKLESQGKLRLDDPLSKFFPEAPADKAAITLHQLLTHSAGFPGAIGDDYDPVDAGQFARLAFERPLDNPPGKTYEYSNVGYSLLGIIVEKVSGQGYETFLREQLWLPAGMHRTGYVLPKFKKEEIAVGYRNGERWGTALERSWLPDGPGWHLRANGGVLSTAGDMYRWYKALKNNTVLPKAATEKMFTQHVAEGPAAESFYGYGWVVQDIDGKRVIWHNGGNGVFNAFMGFDLAADRCIVVSSNSNNKISDDIALQLQAILDGKTRGFDPAWPQRYTGTYRLPSGATLGVRFDENNRLFALVNDANTFLLLATDGSENAAETTAAGERTFRLLDGIRQGDYSWVARYRGVSQQEALERIKPYWEDVQAERGQIQKVEIVGVVARQQAGLHLAFVRVHFAQQPQYMLYVWKGESISDVQDLPALDKMFEWEQGTTFHSRSNGRRITLENTADGTAAIRLVLPQGDLVAVRTGDLPPTASATKPSGPVVVQNDEDDYRNHPVALAVHKILLEKGAAHFAQNSRKILQDAGFDFDDDMPLLGAGERLEEAARWDEAIALFETYTQLFPRIVVAWNRLGKCRQAKGDKAGARAAWEKSVALRPGGNPAAGWLKGLE